MNFFFDLHCNHWPLASVSCNVLIMDVVWSFCHIYKRQDTDQRKNEKIRVERGRHFASLKWLQKSLQNYLQNQCVCHNFSITGRLNLKCMCSCQYLYIRYIILTFTEFFEYQKEIIRKVSNITKNIVSLLYSLKYNMKTGVASLRNDSVVNTRNFLSSAFYRYSVDHCSSPYQTSGGPYRLLIVYIYY